MRAPCWRVYSRAACSNACESFCRRYLLTMKKHTTDQTSWSSTGFKTGERSREGKARRGATEHQATGFPSEYASKPGTSPDATIAFIAWRLPSPLSCSYSERLWRNHIHQQPPTAPRGPNRVSRAPHLSGGTGWGSEEQT